MRITGTIEAKRIGVSVTVGRPIGDWGMDTIVSAIQSKGDGGKLASMKSFKGFKGGEAAQAVKEEKSIEEKTDAPTPTRGFLSRFKTSVKKVIIEDNGKSSISNLVPPFLGFVRKNEKKYANEVGQLNIMLREARGLFEGVDALVDKVNESLIGVKHENINVAVESIKSIKKLIDESDWLFDMTMASSKLEEYYGNTNNPAKAVANNLMAASYSQIAFEGKSNNEDEKVVNIVNNLTESLHYQTKLIGGWRNVLYRMDGTIDQDVVLDDWTEQDKIEILKEINNFNKREIEKLKREKETELQHYSRQLEEAKARHPYANRMESAANKYLFPGTNGSELDMPLDVVEQEGSMKSKYMGEISILRENYMKLEASVRGTIEALRPLYYDAVREKSLINNDAIGSRDKDKNRSASVQFMNMISANSYSSNPGVSTIYPSMTDEIHDSSAVIEAEVTKVSAEPMDNIKSVNTLVKGSSKSIIMNEENIVMTKSIRLQPNPLSKTPASPSQTAGLFSSTSEDSIAFLASPLPVTSATCTRPMSRSSLVNHQARKHVWNKAEEERRRLKGLDVLQRNYMISLTATDTFPVIRTPTKTQRNKSASYEQPASNGTPARQMSTFILNETDLLTMALHEVSLGITSRILFGLQNIGTSKLGINSDTNPSDIMRRAQIINRQLVAHMSDIKVLEVELKKLSFNFNGEGVALANVNTASSNVQDLHTRNNSVSLGTMLRSASKANISV